MHNPLKESPNIAYTNSKTLKFVLQIRWNINLKSMKTVGAHV